MYNQATIDIATAQDTYAAFRNAARSRLANKDLVIADDAEVLYDDDPWATANEDDGADIAVRRFVKAELVPDGNYEEYSKRQRGYSYRNPLPPEIQERGAWVDSWAWISTDDAINCLCEQIPAEIRIETLKNLAKALGVGHVSESVTEMVEMVMKLGHASYDEFKSLFDGHDITVGGFAVMLQRAIKESESNKSALPRPKA